MEKKVKASFTVEAVFVIPIVLFTMVFIIYLSFYLHDYCRMQGIADLTLHKAILNDRHEADIETGKVNYDEINKSLFNRIFRRANSRERDIENYLRMQLSKGLLVTKITEVHVSKELQNISLRVEGKLQIPIKGVRRIISLDNILVAEAKSASHNPAESVRISEIILNTGSKIKGFEKLEKIIGELIP